MDTKEKLLASAEASARAHGYDGFSYADLAADVGIRKASIHHHFPKKRDLALALIERYAAAIAVELDAIADRVTRASDQLRAYIAMYRGALSGGSTLCLCVAFSLSRESVADDVAAAIDRFRDRSVAWLVEVFERGKLDGSIHDVQAPADEAITCLALVEGAQLAARAALSPDRFDSALVLMAKRLA